jgi:hypothetical protein
VGADGVIVGDFVGYFDGKFVSPAFVGAEVGNEVGATVDGAAVNTRAPSINVPSPSNESAAS